VTDAASAVCSEPNVSTTVRGRKRNQPVKHLINLQQQTLADLQQLVEVQQQLLEIKKS